MIRRVTDRVRPWAAPSPDPSAPQVAVIGAGAAGLATAALLRRNGIGATVFDARHQVGGSWPSRYDSLRLNTVRWMSDLPGYRMPHGLGRWVGRDDVVEYLRAYADHHGLVVRLGAPVTRLDRRSGGWRLAAGGDVVDADGVVVATGHARRPVAPDWPGAGAFAGRTLHSADYLRPSDHEGARVLVVGAGSSGGEICVELAGAGVDVSWAVRTAPRVFPREVRHVPSTPVAPIADLAPDRLVDRLAPWVERRIHGPRDYLPEPATPMMELLARCKEPLTADGIVDLIRRGHVRIVVGVTDLDATGALLDDGSHVAADHVITATGYRSGLEPLVGHLGVLDDDGRPTASVFPGPIGFVGFRIPLTGTLWAIEQDARRVAADVAAALR